MSERIGLFADLHSNLEAYEACMARAKELGVTRMAFLGDLVGYNADPCALLDRIADLVDTKQAIVVRGNHDEATFKDYTLQMNAHANAAIEWTKTQLNSAQVQFLKDLPLIIHEEQICYTHASAHNPEAWNYITDSVENPDGAACSRKGYRKLQQFAFLVSGCGVAPRYSSGCYRVCRLLFRLE